MFFNSRSGRQNSSSSPPPPPSSSSSTSPPPPPYAEIDPTPSRQRNRFRNYVGSLRADSTVTIQIGDRIIGPGEGIFDNGNFGGKTDRYDSVSATGSQSVRTGSQSVRTGSQSVRTGNDNRSRRSVSANPTPRQNGQTVVFKMVDGGIKIEGSESAFERAVLVPEHSRKKVELTDGKTISVTPHPKGQFASLISADFSAFGLIFDRKNDVVSVQLETGSPIKLGSGSPYAVSGTITVERQENVVTVRYL